MADSRHRSNPDDVPYQLIINRNYGGYYGTPRGIKLNLRGRSQ
jgi:hypothetical protein